MESTTMITTDVIEHELLSCCSKKIDGQKCSIDLNIEEKKQRKETELAEKCNENAAMGWESLPLLVFRVLFRYIDYRTKLQMRQVCSSWLDIVEFEVALRVEAHESDEDNARFINSVRIKELHLKECFLPKVERLLQPSEIEVLGLYGTTCPYWFLFNMKEDFALIKRLVLRGKGISYLELGKVLGDTRNSYNTNEMSSPPCLIFEHLEKLEIFADSCAFPVDDAFFSHRSVLSPMNHNIIRTIAADIASNICYLLNNIRSKALKAAKIYSYQVNVPENVNWKSIPLKRFLVSHAGSLETLLLPEFSGENENSHLSLHENNFPRNLKTLKIYLCCFMTRTRFGGVQNPIYWLKLILLQHHLENLNLELVCFPENFMTTLMNSIVSKNNLTLTRLELTFIPTEWATVNGNTFSPCKTLESLKILKHMETRPINLERSKFINFCSLPSSLKTLELTGFVIGTDFTAVPKFSKMCHLVLQLVMADSLTRYQRNIQMITNFLNLRHLQYFDFYIGKPSKPLSLSKIKTFVYRGQLFKEHILNTNYISSLSIDYGMQVVVTEEIATIRYAPSICRMHNPESVVESETDEFVTSEDLEDLLAMELAIQLPIPDDAHLIALVQQDLGIVQFH